MARVLHLVGSPRGGTSVSSQLAAAFLDGYRHAHPADTLDTLDVWAEDLPDFAGDAAEGKVKLMTGRNPDDAQRVAFERTLAHIERFKAADKVLVSSGMWNFSVPYRLKHYVDVIVQAGHTFGFDPARGYFGLVTGRPVQLLLATGGDLTTPPMNAYDLLTPFLQNVFGFLGFTDIRTLTASGTAYPPEVSGPAIESALGAARRAGAEF